MLKLFALFNLGNLKQMMRRFPLPVVLVVVITLIFFLLNNRYDRNSGPIADVLSRSLLPLIVVFFFSIGVSFAVEGTGFSRRKKWLFQLIPLVFGVFLYFLLEGGLDDLRYSEGMSVVISFVGVLAFLFFAPYVTTPKVKNSLYYQYFYTLVQVFLFGFIL